MNKLKKNKAVTYVTQSEPVMSLVVGAIAAICALLVSFGVELTPEQTAAIVGAAAAVLALGVKVRDLVKSPATQAAEENE